MDIQENRQDLILELFKHTARISRLMATSKNVFFASYGLNKAQVEVLYLLSERSMHIKDISQVLMTTSSSASQLIEGLVQKGYVSRKEFGEDRRSIVVQMTVEGRKKFGNFRKAHLKRMLSLFESITDEQLEMFIAMAEILLESTLKKSTPVYAS